MKRAFELFVIILLVKYLFDLGVIKIDLGKFPIKDWQESALKWARNG